MNQVVVANGLSVEVMASKSNLSPRSHTMDKIIRSPNNTAMGIIRVKETTTHQAQAPIIGSPKAITSTANLEMRSRTESEHHRINKTTVIETNRRLQLKFITHQVEELI